MVYIERVRRESGVGARLLNAADVYCGDVMCDGNMLSRAPELRIGLVNDIMCELI